MPPGSWSSSVARSPREGIRLRGFSTFLRPALGGERASRPSLRGIHSHVTRHRTAASYRELAFPPRDALLQPGHTRRPAPIGVGGRSRVHVAAASHPYNPKARRPVRRRGGGGGRLQQGRRPRRRRRAVVVCRPLLRRASRDLSPEAIRPARLLRQLLLLGPRLQRRRLGRRPRLRFSRPGCVVV